MPPVFDRPARLLLIHPGTPLRAVLERDLAALGYEMVAVASGPESLEAVARQRFSAAVLNLDTEGVAGLAAIQQLREADPSLAIVVLSSVNEADNVTACMEHGATDYLLQPVTPPRLQRAVRRALEAHAARVDAADRQQLLTEEVARLSVELRRERRNFDQQSVAALDTLVFMMEAQDRYLAGHSVRVAHLAASMAAVAGRTDQEVELVRLAGRLHDIGMLCIGEGILSKQGPLSSEEFGRVKQHVTIGSEILGRLPRLRSLVAFVRSHHERWDGTGYPDGLSGDAIAWGARYLGAAEVYDALTTSRSYREKISPFTALDQMRELVGTALSPDAFEALAQIVQDGRALVFIPGDREFVVGPLEHQAAMAEGSASRSAAGR